MASAAIACGAAEASPSHSAGAHWCSSSGSPGACAAVAAAAAAPWSSGGPAS